MTGLAQITVRRVCATCERTFHRVVQQTKVQSTRYCSRRCSGLGGPRKMPRAIGEYICAACGCLFQRIPRADRTPRLCSPKCIGLYNRHIPQQHPDLDATHKPSPIDVAWAAGIFEGEGWAGSRSDYLYPRAAVSQKDPWILHKLRGFFGGSIRQHTGSGVNHILMWTWRLDGRRARAFLEQIHFLLSPRRKAQADSALGRATQVAVGAPPPDLLRHGGAV